MIEGIFKNWLKETKRGGSVLVGSSIREFFKYYESQFQPISVLDRLPPAGDDVWVCTHKVFLSGKGSKLTSPVWEYGGYEPNLKGDLVWWIGDDEFDEGNPDYRQVTFWMPIMNNIEFNDFSKEDIKRYGDYNYNKAIKLIEERNSTK